MPAWPDHIRRARCAAARGPPGKGRRARPGEGRRAQPARPPGPAGAEPVATFVLVHGAWGGAHGFGKVRRLLHQDGHEVFTPSLTGIGERVHLTSPQVCLTTHVADVANAVLYEDLHDIVLLGFSYGGLVTTGALEHVADRVGHMVYLDAFVPADGDSLETLTATAIPAPAIGPGANSLVPPQPRDFDDPADAAWSTARHQPAPASRSVSGTGRR